MGRPLAILSEGRLSESQIRALTLLSLGWLEVFVAPEPEDDGRPRVIKAGFVMPEAKKKNQKTKRLEQDDEEIYAIISTFIQWQALRSV